jgi:hypothetical protein
MRAVLSAVAFASLLVGAYALSCWWFPFGPCWCCKGLGRHMRGDGKAGRDCWWCKGKGRRRRVGRILYDRWTLRRRA